ncbi:unnamed protein product [marine sediment metagenome]|uniref:Uncharacterized protein n=1 Tax=marine sediment metagenome TaxID=412755 RepID=X0S5F6_9ZZZZ
MNHTKVQLLLKQWMEIIDASEQKSKEKARQSPNGLNGRIRRTTGQPVIFDFDTYQDQQKVQNLLCQELPQYANLIRSQPEIMDGYQWTRRDFIELYAEHFRLVVRKIQRIIDQATDV